VSAILPPPMVAVSDSRAVRRAVDYEEVEKGGTQLVASPSVIPRELLCALTVSEPGSHREVLEKSRRRTGPTTIVRFCFCQVWVRRRLVQISDDWPGDIRFQRYALRIRVSTPTSHRLVRDPLMCNVVRVPALQGYIPLLSRSRSQVPPHRPPKSAAG
jgi:hypothetical protein